MFFLSAAIVTVVVFWRAPDVGMLRQQSLIEARVTPLLRGNAGWLGAVRDKFHALSFALSQDDAVRAYLTGPPAAASTLAINRKFEYLAEGTGASVIYLLDPSAHTLASSNWQASDSFVGNRFGFRPYFTLAMQQGQAEYFALGTSSGKVGLYFSRRIETDDGRILGVIAIKLEMGALEQEWQSYEERLFVTDGRDIILISGYPGWRLRTLGHPPEAVLAAARESRQFGDATLQPADIDRDAVDSLVAIWHAGEESYLHQQQAIAGSDWVLHAMTPLSATMQAHAAQSRMLALAVLVVALVLTALAMQRSQQRREALARQASLRNALETAVAARTEQLRAANQRLAREMAALQEARSRARELREQLGRAEKLSFLGQVAAGIAHEINQPVAAIQTYADNAKTYLEKGNVEATQQNLARIQRLTQRIGGITSQLGNYARKPSPELEAVDIRQALDNAWQLLEHRARAQGVSVDMSGVPPGIRVMASAGRLEQVFVNLLRNALDALQARQHGRILLQAVRSGADVNITISDNGPGLAPQVRKALFTPFNSSRANGLGLGMVISHDIVTELGGRLEEGAPVLGGASFCIVLPTAADKEN